MTDAVAAYLDRIGTTRPARADLEALRSLHRAHLERVPFENVDIHRGRPIELGAASVEKIVGRRRGGFCYELNGAFAWLLRELGFEVTLVQARVHGGDGRLGIPFDHLCLLVDLGGRYLADVGFGDSFVEPLTLTPGVDQEDPAGTYRIDAATGGWFDLLADGNPQYRFETRPRTIDEFVDACAFHQTPASHFGQGIVATRRTPTGRITLSKTTLRETVDGCRHETALVPAEVDTVLADRFGIAPPAR